MIQRPQASSRRPPVAKRRRGGCRMLGLVSGIVWACCFSVLRVARAGVMLSRRMSYDLFWYTLVWSSGGLADLPHPTHMELHFKEHFEWLCLRVVTANSLLPTVRSPSAVHDGRTPSPRIRLPLLDPPVPLDLRALRAHSPIGCAAARPDGHVRCPQSGLQPEQRRRAAAHRGDACGGPCWGGPEVSGCAPRRLGRVG